MLPTDYTVIYVKDVYKDGFQIPEGYEAVEFRNYKTGEWVLQTEGTRPIKVQWDSISPYIILRPLPKPRRWVVEESKSPVDGAIKTGSNDGIVTNRNFTNIRIVEELPQ